MSLYRLVSSFSQFIFIQSDADCHSFQFWRKLKAISPQKVHSYTVFIHEKANHLHNVARLQKKFLFLERIYINRHLDFTVDTIL